MIQWPCLHSNPDKAMAQQFLDVLRKPVVISAGLRSVLNWWWNHLLHALDSLLPSSLKERVLQLEVISDGERLSVRSTSEATELFVLAADRSTETEARERIQAIMHGRTLDRLNGALRLDPSEILRKRISLPAVARNDLVEAIGYQIDLETPFRPADVYFGARTVAANASSILVEISVAVKTDLDTRIALIESHGIPIHRVYCGAQSPSHPEIDLLRIQSPRPSAGRTRVALAGSLFALLAATALAAPLLFKIAEVDTLAALAANDRGLAAPVIEKQRRLAVRDEKSHAFASAIQQFPEPLSLLSALTATIPDDSWLTRLSIRSGEIQISGATPSTSALIDKIAATGLFGVPGYAAPAISDPQLGKERFVLNLRLKPSL